MRLAMPSSVEESVEVSQRMHENGIQSDGAWISKTFNGPDGHRYADGSNVLHNGWHAGTGEPNEKEPIACGFVSANKSFTGLWFDSSCEESLKHTVCYGNVLVVNFIYRLSLAS